MPNQELKNYIEYSLSQGKSKEKIYTELLNQGWDIDTIQRNFSLAVDNNKKENISKKTIQIILIIGAILIGAGIFSFIAANWQEMGKAIKVIIILAAMLTSYGVGWYLREKKNLPKTGYALIILGTIIYGAGIFLVAQIFNIHANWSDGLALWMIGTIALAYAINSYPLFYLSILLGFLTAITYSFESIISKNNQFLLESSFISFTATIVTLIIGWVIRKKVTPELKNFY